MLRTLPFLFGHVTLNEVPQVPGIIMHFLDNTLMPFVAPFLGRPVVCAVLAMQQASSNNLPTVILHSSVSFVPLPIPHRSLHVPSRQSRTYSVQVLCDFSGHMPGCTSIKIKYYKPCQRGCTYPLLHACSSFLSFVSEL